MHMNSETKVVPVLITLILGSILVFSGVMQGIEEREQANLNPNIIITEPITESVFGTSYEADDFEPILDDVSRVMKTEPNTSEWETITMDVSAYCPCKICCEDFSDGITASGHKIEPGDVFVAAPRKYSFGTEMMIPGYAEGKVVEVKDVGGAIRGNKLDVFFATHQEALEFGRIKEHPVKVRI